MRVKIHHQQELFDPWRCPPSLFRRANQARRTIRPHLLADCPITTRAAPFCNASSLVAFSAVVSVVYDVTIVEMWSDVCFVDLVDNGPWYVFC